MGPITTPDIKTKLLTKYLFNIICRIPMCCEWF